MTRALRLTLALLGSALPAVSAAAQATAPTPQSFVNFESAHVHPLELTPSGGLLLAVNTADARLEVLDPNGALPTLLFSVPVGLDPVSVRAFDDQVAWVVNRISDSVSVVNLDEGRVLATLATADDPADVIFAGSPQRAFVSCSASNRVLVFDPADLATPPLEVVIDAERPRALAKSPDGTRVYVAILESGNGTTVLGGPPGVIGFPPDAVGNAQGPWAGQNPPPNSGIALDPPLAPGLPAPPPVALIVRLDPSGKWLDDNSGNWTSLVSGPNAALSGRPVGWTLHDRDVCVLDADAQSPGAFVQGWIERLMNLDMALDVNPVSGRLAVVGTDAINEVRFEPKLNGRFVRVKVALADGLPGASGQVTDGNPHLEPYASSSVPPVKRTQSIGDPRGALFTPDGQRLFVSGMGSNNVAVFKHDGTRELAQPIKVGHGPTGLALLGDTLFVLNRFDASISAVSVSGLAELGQTPFHDATPAPIVAGRAQLYDTNINSGTGHVSCGSCHIDARMDRLAWDLGDPAGEMLPLTDRNLGSGIPVLTGGFADYHPMKGPMLTQTFQDIIGKEPHHWRGDRDGLEGFKNTPMALQGADAPFSDVQMQQFEDFLDTVHFPPNPFRNLDNSLPDALPLPGHFTTGFQVAPAGQPLPVGDATHGLKLFRPPFQLFGNFLACVTCHSLPTGAGNDFQPSLFMLGFLPIPIGLNGQHHLMLVALDGSAGNATMKVPHLRNQWERTGFNTTQAASRSGFGFLHDGTVDSVERFIGGGAFGLSSDQDVADLVAFMLAFSGSGLPEGEPSSGIELPGVPSHDAHAAVGRQVFLPSLPGQVAADAVLATLIQEADAQRIGLIAHGDFQGNQRGFAYLGGGLFQSDAAAEIVLGADLIPAAANGTGLALTAVPHGSEQRLGVDRDEDGVFDRDELAGCADPADASSFPADWTDLGHALAGTLGAPSLNGCGTLRGGDPVTLTLASARPNTSTFLVVGLTTLFAPLKGGVLVPTPDLILGGLSTNAGGGFAFTVPFPAGVPSGLALFLQSWLPDGAGPAGFAASNGLSAHTP